MLDRKPLSARFFLSMCAKPKLLNLMYTLFFLALTLCLLTHSQLGLRYACLGLQLWYEAMVPALLPFMILSGIMIRAGVTEKFAAALYPVVNPVCRVSKNVCYAMMMGFLCGFPMGAKTAADLYERGMLTEDEAKFLLAFCNNIGPIYFVGFALPLLRRRLVLPYLFGMYGLPLLYGCALRYTVFRKSIPLNPIFRKTIRPNAGQSFPATAMRRLPGNVWVPTPASCGFKQSPTPPSETARMPLPAAADESIGSAIQSILSLGGYMILFNLLNILPHILLQSPPTLIAPLFEISGGLRLLGEKFPLYTLLLLPFGGFSCIAQTYSCIKKTPLSLSDYAVHKLLLTLLTGCYYLAWRLAFPASFLS